MNHKREMEMERALEDGVYHIIDSFTVYKLANLSTLLLDADIHLILVCQRKLSVKTFQ
jgi:hypothetical protein